MTAEFVTDREKELVKELYGGYTFENYISWLKGNLDNHVSEVRQHAEEKLKEYINYKRK